MAPALLSTSENEFVGENGSPHDSQWLFCDGAREGKALPLVQETFEERKVLVEGIAQKIKVLGDCGAIEPASKLD